MAGIDKMPGRIANREDPDDLGLPYLSTPFWQANSVQNYTVFS